MDEVRYEVDFTYQGQNVKLITKTLEVKDDPTITEFSKTDIATEEEIAGAELSVLNEAEKVVESWTSTGEKHIIYGLPAGEYILREALAPIEQGYVKAKDVLVTFRYCRFKPSIIFVVLYRFRYSTTYTDKKTIPAFSEISTAARAS